MKKVIIALIDDFLFEFERCSYAHFISDAYQFYQYYNAALLCAVKLNCFSKGIAKFDNLPIRFTTDILERQERRIFLNLEGTFDLSIANQQKRKLLVFFYQSIGELINEDRKNKAKNFCEFIYNRDLLWNFRDIGLFNKRIRTGKIYRTSSLTFIQNEDTFEKIIEKKLIKKVIDLRALKEIEQSGYSEESLKLFNWVSAPFDHYSLTKEFKNKNQSKTEIQTEYYFFASECKSSIKTAVENLIKGPYSIAIHCDAGKARTGAFVTLLHLLSDADLVVIFKDYLSSGMDTKREYLDVLLGIVKEHGGIEEYLCSCNLTPKNILDLKEIILTNK